MKADIQTPTHVYVALGSNLSDPVQQVTQAVNEMNALNNVDVIAQSSWYRSIAIGPSGQPDYINGVALIATTLPPLELLDALQNIENAHGRTRELRWGARTLDLDIILYGEQNIQHERLQVPHIEMHNRNFVLQPLLEINQNIRLPNGTHVSDLLAVVGTDGIEKIKQ